MPQAVTVAPELTSFYATQGVLGVTCLALIFVVIKLWNRLEVKDATIAALYDERIKETRVITDLVRSMEKTLDAFLLTVRSGKGQP